MVVGFEVVPCSIKREQGDDVQQVMCPSWDDTANPEPQKVYEGADIIYTCAFHATLSPGTVRACGLWIATCACMVVSKNVLS